MRFPLLSVLLFLLLMSVPADAHDLQAMRAEYAAESENARMMSRLDCAGLNAYLEQQRWLTYQQTHAEYFRLMPVPTAVPARTIPGYSPSLSLPRPR
jgi:hypothetical protein